MSLTSSFQNIEPPRLKLAGNAALNIVDPSTGETVYMSPRKTPRRGARPASPDSGSSESSAASSSSGGGAGGAGKGGEVDEAIKGHASRLVDTVRAAIGPSVAHGAPRVTIAKILCGAVNVPAYLREGGIKCASAFSAATVDQSRQALRVDLTEGGVEALIVAVPVRGWASLDEWLVQLADTAAPRANTK